MTMKIRSDSTNGQNGMVGVRFENKEYICSDFIVDLLGLESNRISFTEFHQRIREDHRLRLKMNICLFLIWRHTNKCSQSGQKTGKYGCTLRLISKSPIKRDIGI